MRWSSWFPVRAASLLLLAVAAGAPASAQRPTGEALRCDLAGYRAGGGATAAVAGHALSVEWPGTAGERVRLRFGLRDGAPVIRELALAPAGGAWNPVATDVGVEYRVVEGLRRISNQQLAPLRDLNVPLTQEVVDRYKWDVFWDAPLDLSTDVATGNNPPPAAGVAGQPGLPRSPDEVRRGEATFRDAGCAVRSDGARLVVAFQGLALGSFAGEPASPSSPAPIWCGWRPWPPPTCRPWPTNTTWGSRGST